MLAFTRLRRRNAARFYLGGSPVTSTTSGIARQRRSSTLTGLRWLAFGWLKCHRSLLGSPHDRGFQFELATPYAAHADARNAIRDRAEEILEQPSCDEGRALNHALRTLKLLEEAAIRERKAA